MEPPERLELSTAWFEARHPSNWASGVLADRAGTDPALPGLQPGALPTELPILHLGRPMGFEPMVTGPTIQRVSRFATAATDCWYPITESNCCLLDVSQAPCHWTNGIELVEPGRFKLPTSCLRHRRSLARAMAPILASHGRVELPLPD